MRGTEERVRLLQNAIEEEKRRRVEAEKKIRETDSLPAAKEEEKRRMEEAEKRIWATEERAEELQVYKVEASTENATRLYCYLHKASSRGAGDLYSSRKRCTSLLLRLHATCLLVSRHVRPPTASLRACVSLNRH